MSGSADFHAEQGIDKVLAAIIGRALKAITDEPESDDEHEALSESGE